MTNDKKIRLGVLGVGHRGLIAKWWHEDPRVEIVAGADVHEPFLDEFKQSYDTVRFATKNYKEMLARDDVDAVAVCTPDDCHREHGVAVLEAGKHCFLEKPMAINIEDCDALITAWKKSGKHLFLGHNARYGDPFRTAKPLIDKGMIGKPMTLWLRHFVGGGGWAFFHDYRANQKGSFSLLLQKGCHWIDIIHYLMGSYTKRVVGMGSLDVYGGDRPNDLTCDNCPEARTCREYSERPLPGKRMCAFRKEVNVEDSNMILMELENGTHACLLECYYEPAGTDENFYIFGKDASLEFDRKKVVLRTRKGKQEHININCDDPYVQATFELGSQGEGHAGADPRMCREFIDLLCGMDRSELISGDPIAARMAVATGYLGAVSMRNGLVPQEIPPAPE